MATFIGTNGNDILTGTNEADVISGFGGNDIINGGLGADTLNGGDGDDLFRFTSIQSSNSNLPVGLIDGGAGFDVVDLSNISPNTVGTIALPNGGYGLGIYVGSQKYQVINIEQIWLGAGADYISLAETGTIAVFGGGGSDQFYSGANQFVFGEAGDDRFFLSGIFGQTATGGVDGGEGNDTLTTNISFEVDLRAGTARSGGASYAIRNIENVVVSTNGYLSVIRGDDSANILSVSNLNDDGSVGVLLDGRGGNDTISGSAGADTLIGGDGMDLIKAGGGRDILTGGTDMDTFAGAWADLAGDVITDFSQGDSLSISDVAASGLLYSFVNSTLSMNGRSILLADYTSSLFLRVGSEGQAVFTTTILSPNDFNGDGRSDILWRNTSGALSTWQFGGGGDQAQGGVFNASVDPSWKTVETADFNGDGLADILWRHSSGVISIWNALGGGNIAQGGYVNSSVGNDWRLAAAGDINGDGKADLLWQYQDGAVSVWRSVGTGFVEGAYSHGSVGASWKVEGLADVNGDGRADIVWRNDNGAVSTWLSTGTGFQEGAFNSLVPSSWHIDGLGDFNGDGRADILWRNDNGALSIWRSNGSGFDQGVYNASVSTSWNIATVGDFNADGRADILWRHDSGALSTWQSNGSGFNQSVYNNNVPTSWSIIGHDFPL